VEKTAAFIAFDHRRNYLYVSLCMCITWTSTSKAERRACTCGAMNTYSRSEILSAIRMTQMKNPNQARNDLEPVGTQVLLLSTMISASRPANLPPATAKHCQ
jgi:hypothetical protein